MPDSLQIIILFIGIFVLVLSCVSLVVLLGIRKKTEENNSLENMQYIQNSFSNLGEILTGSQRQATEIQDKRLHELNFQLTQRNDTLQKTVYDALGQIDTRLKDNYIESEQKLEQIRQTMEKRITLMQDENSKKLDEMRATVDEKLQKTLEDRIGKSFQLVSERLEQVYKGLGEMQNLAIGVGDLKKVLSNVKTRGILGEIQLGAILEQMLSPEQYKENVSIKKGSQERVEFAVKLPGDGEGEVYLPIDAKFPADTYTKLIEAYETGNPAEVDQALKTLERAIKTFAKSIHDKYIDPPQTTDFGIMFLPFEGLYAEVVRRGLVETLQRDYKINIAGPTTMAALLNSLQMGFKTLAIQKHSSEVWNVLGAVKTEFNKFGDVLAATQQRINQANAELDKLVGTRTRQIQRKLRNVASLPETSGGEILSTDIADNDTMGSESSEEK